MKEEEKKKKKGKKEADNVGEGLVDWWTDCSSLSPASSVVWAVCAQVNNCIQVYIKIIFVVHSELIFHFSMTFLHKF